MKIFKLKDISEFIRNGVTIKQNISSKEGIPITRIETISKGIIDFDKLGYADIFEFEKYKDWLLKKGDILISHINSEKHLGKSAIFLDNDVSIIHGMNLLCIRVIDDIVFPEYLQLFFKTNQYKRQIKKIMKKSVNQASFSVNDFKEILIRLPKLDIQEKIIKKIMTLEKILENNKLKLKFLSELNKSLFATMFGDIKTNDKNWEIKKFHEIISILTDYHANGSYKILKDNVELLDFKEYALMIRTTDLENNNFIKGVKYINEKAYNFLKKTKIFGGELIINKIGSAGNVYLMPYLNIPVSLGMNQFMIRLKKDYSNIFYYKLLTTEYYTNVIKSNVQGAVTKTITKEAIKNIDIIIPPIELQNKFAERIEKIEKLSFISKELPIFRDFQALYKKVSA